MSTPYKPGCFAVEHGTGNAFLILGYLRIGANAEFLAMAIIAERTGIPAIKKVFHAK
jgi:hypothetical protein